MLRKVMPSDHLIVVRSKEKEKEVGSRGQLVVLSVCHRVVRHQEPCGPGFALGGSRVRGPEFPLDFRSHRAADAGPREPVLEPFT